MKSRATVALSFVLVVAFAASAFSYRQEKSTKDEVAEVKEQIKQLGDKVSQLEKNNKYLEIKVEGLEKELKESRKPKIIPIYK